MNEAYPTDFHIGKKRRWWRSPLVIIAGIILFLAVVAVGGVKYMDYWYTKNVRPLSSEQKAIRVVIPSGATVKQIGGKLHDQKVIRNAQVFEWYVSRHADKSDLRAGTYLLSPNYSIEKIVNILASGKVDSYSITLAPGDRIDQIENKLVKAGFNKQALDAALAKKYDGPLFADKPDGTSLEGYIFPDTYSLSFETTPEQFLQKTFDNFYQHIQQEGLVAKLQAQGLNLYQGITLASIVQQEVEGQDNQRVVAQVFLKRLHSDISLGSDVTFMYAAHKLGIAANPGIDSPYNTRIYKGLPPGPIGNFNLTALEAVSNPAATDYLFFVAGDDGKLYFSNTQEEHDALTREHCVKWCQE
jgi:UPF0755 protein